VNAGAEHVAERAEVSANEAAAHASLRSLRSQHVAQTVLGALRASNRDGFRLVHYSIQDNHLHLIVEAESKKSLSSGVRGLMVRVARRVNRLLFRRGRLWGDRWHGHALTGPRQVRNALVYVLQNHRKHARSPAVPLLDPLSSSHWFDGFCEPIPADFRGVGPPSTQPARSWLLTLGWRRRGLIRFSEAPKPEK
jgi:REP element-mobilizing transposase RayT